MTSCAAVICATGASVYERIFKMLEDHGSLADESLESTAFDILRSSLYSSIQTEVYFPVFVRQISEPVEYQLAELANFYAVKSEDAEEL
jgi:hypothetical protein